MQVREEGETVGPVALDPDLHAVLLAVLDADRLQSVRGRGQDDVEAAGDDVAAVDRVDRGGVAKARG